MISASIGTGRNFPVPFFLVPEVVAVIREARRGSEAAQKGGADINRVGAAGGFLFILARRRGTACPCGRKQAHR